MRTGATQSSPTANPDVQVTVEGDLYTTQDGGRVTNVLSHEQLFGGEYVVELDNSDDALTAKNYKGSALYLYFGFIGNAGSTLHLLTVDSQEFTSKEGKLLLRLHAIDRWGRLALYTADLGGSMWNYPEQSHDSLLDRQLPSGADIPLELHNAIEGQYDQTIENIVDTVLYNTMGTVATPEVGHSDPAYYAAKPLVNATDARSVIAQAMQGCSSYLKLVSNAFNVVNPNNGSIVYSYNTANLFFSNIDYQALVRPNTIVFHGITPGGTMLATQSPHGENSASILKLGHVYYHAYYGWDTLEKLTTQAEVDDAADIYLAKLVLGLSMGTIVAPMHCSQELMDKVEIVDSRYSSPRTTTGYVYEIIREYSAGIYRITLVLGGVATYYTPSGGGGVVTEPIPPSIPPDKTEPFDMSDIPAAIQGYQHDVVFTSVDWDTVSWTAGTIKFYDSSTQAIMAGSVDLPSALLYYIYFDLLDASPSVLKVTSDYMSVMTTSTGVIAIVKRGSDSGVNATVIPSYGKEPLITSDIIYLTGLLDRLPNGTYGKVLSTHIQAGKIKLQADTVKDGKWYDTAGVSIDAVNGIILYGTNTAFRTRATYGGVDQTFMDSSGALMAGGGHVWLDASGLTLQGAGMMQFYEGLTHIATIESTSGTLYITSMSTKDLVLEGDKLYLTASGTGNKLVSIGNILPSSDNYWNLGESTHIWHELWVEEIYSADDLYLISSGGHTWIQPSGALIVQTGGGYGSGVIDMGLSNGFVVSVMASSPSSKYVGMIWYNSSLGHFYGHAAGGDVLLG